MPLYCEGMHIPSAIRNVVNGKIKEGQCCVPFHSCFTPHGRCGIRRYEMRYLPAYSHVSHLAQRHRFKDLGVHDRIPNRIL
jgi:hypothetical protein